MGARGPAPTPTKLKLLRGETKESRLNRNPPRVSGTSFPTMPDDMAPAAQRIWRRVRRDYGSAGVITSIDAELLRAYCEAGSRYVSAATKLEESGPLIRGARLGELVKNPLHQIVRDNAELLRRLGRELGLSPAGRESLRNPAASGSDPLEAWLRSGEA